MYYEVVAEFARKKDLSIAKVEKQAGLQNGTIGKWRNSNPNISNLEAVADALSVPVEALIKRAGELRQEVKDGDHQND